LALLLTLFYTVTVYNYNNYIQITLRAEQCC